MLLILTLLLTELKILNLSKNFGNSVISAVAELQKENSGAADNCIDIKRRLSKWLFDFFKHIF